MEPTNPALVAAQQASRAAATAAVTATVAAIQTAAVNAGKPGSKSSEFKVAIGGILVSALIAGLKVAAVIPGPWTLPAMVLSAGVTAGAYALSRGQVKKAALDAASAVVNTLAPPSI
jgi:hypothetical protein